MSLPCIHDRPGCKCTPCPLTSYLVTVNVGYGCPPAALTPGTINSVTIGGVVVAANPDGTYTSTTPGLAIVVNWTAGSFGTFNATGATQCGNVTVQQTVSSDLSNIYASKPVTTYCCGGFLFPAIYDFTSTGKNYLTLNCLLGTARLYIQYDSSGFPLVCNWAGGYDVADAYGNSTFYNFGLQITGNGTFKIGVGKSTQYTSVYCYTVSATGSLTPLDVYFPATDFGPVSGYTGCYDSPGPPPHGYNLGAEIGNLTITQ